MTVNAKDMQTHELLGPNSKTLHFTVLSKDLFLIKTYFPQGDALVKK